MKNKAAQFILLAFVILTSSLVQAQVQTRRPETTPRPNLTDTERMNMILESKELALNILTKAVPNYSGRLQRQVERIRRTIQFYPFIYYPDAKNGQKGCANELAFADIRPLQRDVKLCPLLFNYEAIDRAQVLIHESIHLVDDDLSECDTTDLEMNIMQQAGYVPFENGYVRGCMKDRSYDGHDND